MDSAILAAVIGAGATISVAIGGFIARSEWFTRLLSKSTVPELKGTRWESTWHDGSNTAQRAIFEFTHQKHDRVYGTIEMHGVRDLRWKFEGYYDGRFLRLFWHPDPNSPNRFALDLGCYFYELRGDGSFDGYGVGFEYEVNRVEHGKDQLIQIR